MKKKVALISGWYSDDDDGYLTSDQEFIFSCFFNSAKKYFTPDQDLDLIFITNSKNININISGVKNLKIDYETKGFWHICLMKILSLKFIKEEYDFIFVSDYDTMFVDNIKDELFEEDLYIMDHYYRPLVKDIHADITNTVKLNFDANEKLWTMGNFFGGKYSIMMDLQKFAEEQHNLHVKEFYDNEIYFYSRYPEELFLIKYVYEKNINHKRLLPTFEGQKNPGYFSMDFPEKESSYPVKESVKKLHNTKKDINLLEKVAKYYTV